MDSAPVVFSVAVTEDRPEQLGKGRVPWAPRSIIEGNPRRNLKAQSKVETPEELSGLLSQLSDRAQA